MEKTFKENSKRVNKIFLKIDPKLREKMQPSKYFSESYTDAINIKIPEQTVLINELKQVFFSLKSNKSPGDQWHKCQCKLLPPLQHILDLCLSQGIVFHKLKTAKVTPICNND